MEIIISNVKKVKSKDIVKIAAKMPDTISSVNMLKEYTKCKLKLNLETKPIYSYIKKGKKIISFGIITNQDSEYEKILNKLGVQEKNYFIGTDLFTTKTERGKRYAERGKRYAKILKEAQIKYIKNNYPSIKKLVGATIDKGLLNLYKL